jgi:ligand-binding sensor domain-containing protein
MRAHSTALYSLLTTCFVAGAASAQSIDWEIIKPSTTGVPGEEVRLMEFDPDGNLWVGARFYFWGEVGLAMLSADQVPLAPPVGGGPGFDTGDWQVWSSVHHPIPSQFLFDIEFGANGVIWLASEAGLTRFDRNAPQNQQWFTYNAANSPLILDGVQSIDFDSRGHLWIVNSQVNLVNGALFDFNPANGTWVSYEVGDEMPWFLPWKNISDVLVGADDHVWVTHSVLGGLAEYDGAQWVLHDNNRTMGGMLEDLQGNIWLRSADSGLWKWNGATFENFDLGSQGTVTALGMDPASGLVYAGSWYGDIFRMVGGNTPVFLLNAQDIPGNILIQSNGHIWINNYGGNGVLGQVRHYDANGALLERFNTFNSGLPDYFVENIQTDSRGNMWFATGEGGLSRFDGSRWRNFGNHNFGSEAYPFAGNEPMYAMFEDSAGNIWMGGNGVARWNQNAGQFTGFWNYQNSSFGVDDMNSFAQTPDGTIWVGCGYAGAFSYDAQANNWVQKTWGGSGSTYNEVQDMETDTQGNLWILTYVQLHRRTPQGQWTTWDSTNSPLPLGSLFALERDPSGGIWVGTQAGLHHFDGSAWTLTTKAQAGWPAQNVVDVAHRADGLLAVATQNAQNWPYTGGVSFLGGGAWTHHTPQNSPMTHWQIARIVFDNNGDLWLSPMSEGVMVAHLSPASTPATINSFSINVGTKLSGNRASLREDDDSSVHVESGLASSGAKWVQMTVTATSPETIISQLGLRTITRVNMPGVAARVWLRNWDTNRWVLVGSFSQPTVDTLKVWPNIANPNAFVRDSDGRMQVRLRLSNVTNHFQAWIDQVGLDITP